MTKTITVLMAVARLELTPSIPTLARMEVNVAKTEDRIANSSHIITLSSYTRSHSMVRRKPECIP